MTQHIYSRFYKNRVGFDHAVIRINFRFNKFSTGKLSVPRENGTHRRYVNLPNGVKLYLGHRRGSMQFNYIEVDVNGFRTMRSLLREHGVDPELIPADRDETDNVIPTEVLLRNDIPWRQLWREQAVQRVYTLVGQRHEAAVREIKALLPDSSLEWMHYSIASIENTSDIISPMGVDFLELEQTKRAFASICCSNSRPIFSDDGGFPKLKGWTKDGIQKKLYGKPNNSIGNINRLERTAQSYKTVSKLLEKGTSFKRLEELHAYIEWTSNSWYQELLGSFGCEYKVNDVEVDVIHFKRIAAGHPNRSDLVLETLKRGEHLSIGEKKPKYLRAYRLVRMAQAGLLRKVDAQTFTLNPAYRDRIRRELKGKRHAK